MRALLLAAFVLAGLTSSVAAEPLTIKISSPWLRATPKGAPVAGGYATLTNTGGTADTLTGASLAGAAKGEIHSMTMESGVMHMAKLDKGLPIAPGARVTLSPGSGYHLMFLTPTVSLKEGQSIKGTLTFAKAGSISVTFQVGGMAAKSAPGAKPGMGAMPGMDMH